MNDPHGARALLSRRGVLGAGAVLGAGLAAGAARASDTPRRGGLLRLGLAGGSSSDSLDPRTYNDTVNIVTGHALFNGLVEWGADGKPYPELAERFEAKPGAREWVFDIRKDVQFSNGRKLTADDVVYSLNLHRGKTSSGAAGSFKAVADVRKLDTHQVLVTLAAPDADFAYVLTDYHVLVVPDGQTDFRDPPGTGGYRMAHFDPGVRIRMTRNPDYWKPDRAFVDAIDLTVINDDSARTNALIAGETDVMNRVNARLAKLIQKNPRLSLVRATAGVHNVISMMEDRTPFGNRDVRLALRFAIDRVQLVDSLFGGYGALGNDQPIPRSDPYFNSDLPQVAFDAERARFHWKQAGSAAAPIVVQASDAAINGVQIAQLFQAGAAKCGIPVTVQKEPADGFWSNVWLKGSCVTSYWGGRAAATQMLAIAYAPDAPWNESHYRNPKFGVLLAEAKAELDEAKRKPMIWELQRMLHDDVATIIPDFRDFLDAHNVRVGGHTPHHGFDLDNNLICEKAWLRS